MNGIRACFQGRLGGDAELKTVREDLTLCSFSLAVDVSREEQEPQWIRVSIFGDKAREYAGLRKGDEVYCEGALMLRQWQGKDGGARTELSVSAWRVEVLGKIGRQSRKAKRKAKDDDEPFDDPNPFLTRLYAVVQIARRLAGPSGEYDPYGHYDRGNALVTGPGGW